MRFNFQRASGGAFPFFGAGGAFGGRGGPGGPSGRGPGRGDGFGHGPGGGRGAGGGPGHRGGPGGGRGRGGPRGDDDASPNGGRGPRLFEPGDMKLLTLHLLAQGPAHGYELIKAIAQQVGGDYSPSPGSVYPTLTYLVDVGFASVVDADGDRKRYAITDTGRQQLASLQDTLQRLQARLDNGRAEHQARGAPEIRRAMGNLKMALQLRFAQGQADPALIRQVAELLDQAAVAIERL